MNHYEALAEARRRWGNDADAWYRSRGKVFVVRAANNCPIGVGNTFDEAFADADRREKEYKDEPSYY